MRKRSIIPTFEKGGPGEISHEHKIPPIPPLLKGGTQFPLRGAYCDIEELTGARFAAALTPLSQQRVARAQLLGNTRSALRGRGLEFEEVRAYQAGDDMRTIDWRVTARSGRPFTKLFREEREKPLLIVVDQRQSMFFGSRHCFKSKLAAYLGAWLAWAGLERGDRVGGLVIGNRERREIRPRRSRKTVMSWLRVLLAFNRTLQREAASFSSELSLSDALTDLRRIAKPGSAIHLISDFRGVEHPQVREHLHAIARHCEITAICVYDALERELPPPALYAVTDGSARRTIDSGDRHVRETHRHTFEQHMQFTRQLLHSLAIPLLEIGTEQPPLQQLAASNARSRIR